MVYGYGNICHMQAHIETQKITAHLPKADLKMAQEVSGAGITETLKAALKEYALKKVYRDFLSLRGTHKFSLDLNELRKDRDED